MILTLAGWLVSLGLLYVSGSSAWHAWRDKAGRELAAAAVFACLAVTALAFLGALAVIPAAVTAAALAAAAAVTTLLRKETSGDLLGHLAEGIGLGAGRTRGLLGWLRLQGPSAVSRARDGADGPAAEVVAEAVASRGVPPVMSDPALGAPPEPADAVPAGVPVPAPYAALAQFIADFEPADDLELRMFMDGHAAGSLAIADAWHGFSESALNGVGLDPAYVAGLMEAGNSAAEHASLLAQVHKRFDVIYGAVKEWISGHGPLPKNARDFLTGDL